ncbi:MAG: serine dehydratase subunit alpha family protein [Oscillospiraceae bacterium]
MKKQDFIYNEYLNILREDLLPALGCTEPISVAFCAAKAVEILGKFPDEIVVYCSGNIIKNVKGVYVPNAGKLKGINASAIIGALIGDSSKQLQILQDVTNEDVEKAKDFLEKGLCKTELIENVSGLYIIVKVKNSNDNALVEIRGTHTNIIKIEKNGEIIHQKDDKSEKGSVETDRSTLNIEQIYNFANSVDIDDVQDILDLQITYNTAIADEGLKNKYGANVGSTILKYSNNDVKSLAKAYTAAGSDARMSGCSLPVIINSGSGNQGITVSVPVIQYAKHLDVPKEKLYRALVLSNLVAIYQKNGIGRLSAYCGVVSAACASGAAITYLHEGSLEKISKTIVNTLGDVSGIICDGANSSCAAKIASSIDAAILSHEMAMDDICFASGDGIIKDTVDETIKVVGKLAKEGMKETDVEILKIMIND